MFWVDHVSRFFFYRQKEKRDKLKASRAGKAASRREAV
jgi:hypothetical protein